MKPKLRAEPMKQILQNLSNGETSLVDVPRPHCDRKSVLIRTSRTLVSAGTERMLVEFGKAGWLDKARQQPDKVKMVLEKARTDGVLATVDAVRSKLDQPLPLGYCHVGVVEEVGADVTEFAPGDRVVSNGHHAEFVSIPKNLVAKIPHGVSDDDASFTVLGAIGLQGIRLAAPTLGETIVVMGLGLIGLMTVQMLRAHGCRVIGLDFDKSRLKLAEELGAQTVDLAEATDPVQATLALNNQQEVDAVLIAAATQSNDPVSHAAKMTRKRGRIVLIGVAGLELSRADFFQKELTFQVSCSYGPGRYDERYEQQGQDYPVGFVRWTEQRNFTAVLQLLSENKLEVQRLITHRYEVEQAVDAYGVLANESNALGILLQYSSEASADRTVATGTSQLVKGGARGVSVIGAGNYASRVLVPALAQAGCRLRTLVSAGGVSSTHHARKNGFEQASTDAQSVFEDPQTDAVVLATRHDQHANQALDALRAGKHVFCEKPLCLTQEELDEIAAEAKARPEQLLLVGFNRRFAPLITEMRQLLGGLSGPKALVFTINAGTIPADHWVQDPKQGGGRIVGEGCHFIDLARCLVGSPISGASAVAVGTQTPAGACDNAHISLSFEDGSSAVIHYLSQGHKGFPKERVEAFVAGAVLQLDNFKTLRSWGTKKKPLAGLGVRQDKGNSECAERFVRSISEGGHAPITLDEILEVSSWSINLQNQLDRSSSSD